MDGPVLKNDAFSVDSTTDWFFLVLRNLSLFGGWILFSQFTAMYFSIRPSTATSCSPVNCNTENHCRTECPGNQAQHNEIGTKSFSNSKYGSRGCSDDENRCLVSIRLMTTIGER